MKVLRNQWGVSLLVATISLGAVASTVIAGTHAVRLPGDAAGTIAELQLNPIVDLDYGAFGWLVLADDDMERLRTSGRRFVEQPSAFTLRLGEQSFDPAVSVPVAPAGWATAAGDGPDLHLVQFVGPTKSEWLAELAGRGLEVVQYVHPFTYIAWGVSSQRAAAAASPSVRWAGAFSPAYRVLPRWRGLPEAGRSVNVLLYRGADTNAAILALEQMGAVVLGRDVLNGTFEVAELTLSGTSFQNAAKIPGVYSIQPNPTDGGLRTEMADQVNVNNVDETNLAFPGYMAWLADVGFNGAGVIIANVDGGIQDSHPDLVSRLVGCSGQTCGGSASSSHGTHTAGIMAGDGSSGVLDSFGFLRGLGVSPGANLVEQTYSGWYQQPGGMLLLMTDSYNNGASLSGNSWGPSGSPLGYDNHTMQVDIGVRDTDPKAPGNQPLTFVLSFMNGNGGTSSQGTPDEAKNLFNIGSTKMQNSGGSQILQIDDLSSNTAHGPALDGRTIPHMVAPGCLVDSSTSGSGYTLMCGTSMASPHVSGAVAMFIEYYRSLPDYIEDPSPALIKGAFLPVSRDLAGHHDADGGILGHPFDSKQGWGRMDLEAVVDPALTARYFDNPMVFNATGEEWVTDLSPVDSSQPMRFMLVWTDAPGHGLGGSAPAWNNDLDLVVQVGGNTYHGNNFDANGWSQAGGSPDLMNNTEGVFLGPTSPGGATIRVVAANINSDGVPNQGDETDQDFALVCYNCAEEPGFNLTVDPGDVVICAPDDAVFEITVGQILGYTEPVTLSASGHPAGTTVLFSQNPIVPPGVSTMTITNTGAAAVGSHTIEILGAAPELDRGTVVDLTVYDGAPGDSLLTAPPNGEIGVSLVPEFMWTAAVQGAAYDFDLATDSGFNNIVESVSGLEDTTHTASSALDRLTTHYWRVRAHNLCGVGPYSATSSFTTRDLPAVLLVDDDDNSPDVISSYTTALDALGQDYDLWDTNNSDGEPDAATVAQYGVVVWFTGDEFGGSCGPGAAGEAALGAFLDAGGCLFMSSQDYHFDRGLTSFMSNYLGVASVADDVGQSMVTGVGPVFGGMGQYVLAYPFSNWSDRVTPGAGAELAFDGDDGDAAIAKDNGVYRSMFWGFPFEAIGSADDRRVLMSTVLDWCAAAQVPDCNGNGVPDDAEALADYDMDCDVDMADFGSLQLCYTGPNLPFPMPLCSVFDNDDDGDIDVLDVADYFTAVTGPQ